MKLLLVLTVGGFFAFVATFIYAVTKLQQEPDFIEMNADRRRSMIAAGREQAARMGVV